MKEYIYTGGGVTTRIASAGEGILRVTRTKRGAFADRESDVVIAREGVEARLTENDREAVFAVGPVQAHINKRSGALAFFNDRGEQLLREPERGACLLTEKPVYLNRFDENTEIEKGEGVDGVRAYAKPSETWLDRTAYECRQRFVFNEDEALYGLGSHEEGYGNLRGKARYLYQHNMKAVVPVLISTGGWGLLFDMGCLMAFHDDAEGSCLWAECADEVDWYFFYKDGTYGGAMSLYRQLTGPAPLLPLYALGYIQSKERYRDAREMLDVADEYRRRGVPLDMLVLDWQSWPEGQWGWKTFDPARFPDPKAFIEELHQKGVKLMISIWPSMQGERNEDRAEMLAHGCMLGNRLIYDAFSREARELYWKQAENLFSKGVDAWWCDCSEPFESDWHGEIKPEEFDRVRMNTDEAKRYLDPAKINLYSLFHARGIYEGQRSATSEKRVCNLTRSSYAGQHRYATVTWSGDVSAKWETLRRHVPEGMNFCATGEPWWSTDIGAFFPMGGEGPWFIDGDFDRGAEDPGYRELFVRWMQYAVFLPMMRSHGTGTPREIWRFGEKGEPFYDAIEKAIRLRYHLVPYLYTLAAQTCFEGIPMLRVPALMFPKDSALREIDDQMLLGDSILVKPVTRPMRYLPDGVPLQAVEETETVYLPEGHQWYALDTDRVYAGGQTINTQAPLDVIPAFVRAGTILPWGGSVQSTAELRDVPLELIVYPGENGSFRLYEDAGDGYGYETGEYSLIRFDWDDGPNLLTIHEREGSFPGMPEKRMMLVRLIGQETRSVLYDGSGMRIRLREK